MLGLGDALAQAWLVKQPCVILVMKLAACEGGMALPPCLVAACSGAGGAERCPHISWLLNFFIPSLERL